MRSQGSETLQLRQITLSSHWSQLGFKFPSMPGFKTQFQMTAWVIRSSVSWLRGLWFWVSTVMDVLRMVRVVFDSALPIMGFTFLLYLGLPMFQADRWILFVTIATVLAWLPVSIWLPL